MKLVLEFIEQMDVALQLLRERRPLKTRLAFIMVDNVVELTMRTKAHDLTRFHYGEPPAPPNHFKWARTGGPRDRTKLLVQLNVIDVATKGVLDGCHDIRNKAYHRGDAFEAVLWDIAVYFFDRACGVFESCFGDSNLHADAEVGEAVAAIIRVGNLLNREVAEQVRPTASLPRHAVAVLRAMCPRPARRLAQVLADDLRRQVEDLRDTLAYIAEGHNWREEDGFEPVLLVQDHWLRAFCPRAPRRREYADEETYLRAWNDYQAQAVKFLPGQVLRSDPSEKWLVRAGQLAEQAPEQALPEYLNILSHLSPLQEAADDIGRGIDEAVNMAIDDAKIEGW